MKNGKNFYISPLKIIIACVALIIIIWALIVWNLNKDKEANTQGGMKIENKVVYREDSLPFVEFDQNNMVVDGKPDISIPAENSLLTVPVDKNISNSISTANVIPIN